MKIQLAVGLDAGSARTRCVICSIENGGIRYLAHGLAPAAGWSKGRVSDPVAVAESIRAAVTDAELGAQVSVDALTVGIGGAEVRGAQSRGLYEFGRPRELAADDLEYAVELAADVRLERDRTLLHVLPQHFTLDTGFSRDAFGDSSWEPVIHPEDVRSVHETYYAAINSGQPYNLEYRLTDRRENRWRWFVGRAVPVRDAEGRIVKWFGTCTDIDEQKRVQDELRRANEDLEQFAFSASHDLQEPLRSVKIYSELLATRHGEEVSGDALKFLAYVRNGATRMEMLVRDLLSYTQVTKLESPGETTDANEALAGAIDNLAGAIAESGAKITADPLPTLPVHEMHLQQVFQNLIGNAIKYRSPERPPVVHVATERRDGHWIFAVSDNGIGVDPAYKENIFGLFKRLHTSEEYSGTGIGLAICQRIVDRYHGRIWVESELGRGSTFRFKLPV